MPIRFYLEISRFVDKPEFCDERKKETPYTPIHAFEEEEEGTGVASDVVKGEGEDLATPGPLP